MSDSLTKGKHTQVRLVVRPVLARNYKLALSMPNY